MPASRSAVLSGEEILLVLFLYQIREIILGAAVPAKRSAVRELLDVVQAAGNAAIAAAVEGVEVDGRPADDPGVQLRAVQDGLAVRIHHAGFCGAVGIDEP